ncbi:MAG: cob(I)yrinic acid a,c-diamide adenosyltransferase [Patescibacteria group bacterium]
MPIYTRRGDRGTTRIYGTHTPVSKTDPRVAALGTIDELNAQLGLVLVHCKDRRVRKQLLRIQQDFFEIGAELATAPNETPPFKLTKNAVSRLERWIDAYWKNLPPLANFIFPGGSMSAAQLHVARTVARRAERKIVEFSHTSSVNPTILSYLNRLSDFFLVAARWVNHREGVGDVVWSSTSRENK